MKKTVDLKVVDRSGFDKSHKNCGTMKVGTITPIMWDILLPNSDISYHLDLAAQLPPLASDCYMRTSIKTEAFFVPLRLLYGGFEDWFTKGTVYDALGNSASVGLPFIKSQVGSQNLSQFQSGSLADYLGYGIGVNSSGANVASTNLNIFPFLAYHKIYDDWYRNAMIQSPIFRKKVNGGGNDGIGYINGVTYSSTAGGRQFTYNTAFNDGVGLMELRQRNWDSDYFTMATANPELRTTMSGNLSISVPSSNGEVDVDDASGSVGKFTISALRAANSVQQFAERNNIIGTRLVDYVRGAYGAHLSNGVAQRPVLLGSAKYNVYTNGVYASNSIDLQGSQSTNPFDTVGAKYGSASCVGSDFSFKFHTDEPGIIMVMATLVPEANYSHGIKKQLKWFTSDTEPFPDAALQNVGPQPILAHEVVNTTLNGTSVFGYIDRYAEFMDKQNEIHGELKDDESLGSFIPQRSFAVTDNVSVNSSFIQIPTTALDNVSAVQGQISVYGAWYDTDQSYKVIQPLAEYSMPSLQNPAYEHGKTETVKRNGTQLN